MDLFQFDSYKTYVVKRVQAMPRRGHGEFTKIAKTIGVNPVIVTQVLKGDRDFNEEQGLRLGSYLGLRGLELDYFMRLIAFEKAGTHDLKAFHREALNQLRREADKARSRIAEFRELDEAAKSVFYSDWSYSATRLSTLLDRMKTPEAIADKLGISRTRANEIVEFLLSVGLCEYNAKGELDVGPNSTHLDASSRFVNSHRRNWRIKGLESLNRVTPEELLLSAPCAISNADFQFIKSALIDILATLTKRAPNSKPETLACLNIDWFKL